jgi:phosphohistidine phosphatase
VTLSDATPGRNRRFPCFACVFRRRRGAPRPGGVNAAAGLLVPGARRALTRTLDLDNALLRHDPRTVAIVLDLLRHGLALPAGAAGDQLRVLSPAGIRGIEALATRLAREAWRPDRIFSSPCVRTLQTARIVAGATTPPVAVEILDALEPERGSSEVLDALSRPGITAGHILVVGHQPLLGLMVGRLTGFEKGFSPGMLVRVHCPQGLGQGNGQIVLTLEPEDLEPA